MAAAPVQVADVQVVAPAEPVVAAPTEVAVAQVVAPGVGGEGAAAAAADVELTAVKVPDAEDELATQSIQGVQDRSMTKPVPYTPHNGENRQYMRDVILGVNDGLVSMFLLVFGMSGGGSTSKSILLACITGAIAGAISMGLGEYIATKSQAEVVESDMKLEKEVRLFGIVSRMCP